MLYNKDDNKQKKNGIFGNGVFQFLLFHVLCNDKRTCIRPCQAINRGEVRNVPTDEAVS